MPPKKKLCEILQPINGKDCKFYWNELKVQKSNEVDGGAGVFARINLKAGTLLPILGRRITPTEHLKLEEKHQATHVWVYDSNLIIDGRDAVNNTNLNIAMKINESKKRKHNCIFKLNMVCVAINIKAGDELTVYYGQKYESVRKTMGYSLAGNKYLDANYPALDEKKWPSSEVRNDIINKWLDVLEGCEKGKVIDLTQDEKPKVSMVDVIRKVFPHFKYP